MANGDPESSVNDGSPVSLVGPTLNRYRIAMRSYVFGIGNGYTEYSRLAYRYVNTFLNLVLTRSCPRCPFVRRGDSPYSLTDR
jgi:hypothetical protein